MTSLAGHYSWLAIVVVVALLALILYRRGRRLIGHQRFHERRIIFRVVLLGALSVFLLVSYGQRADPMVEYAGSAGGFLVGLVIALVALRFTQMGRDAEGVWYVPNLYLGIGLIALLIARYVYEYVVVFPQIRKDMTAAAARGTALALPSQPVLHGILFLVLGYYVIYYLSLLVRARREGHLGPKRQGPDGGGQ